MKNSTKNILKIIVIASSLSLGSAGCATMSGEELFGTFLKTAAVAGKGNATWCERQAGMIIGDLFQEQGRRKHELDVAEKQRTRINFNFNNAD